MTDIALVIKIPKKAYDLLNNKGVDWLGAEHILNAVANGIPLPKGHGRLIDADKLKAKFQEHHDFYIDAYGGFSSMPIQEKSRVDEIIGSIASVVNAPTIIEADKGE